jgi:adenosylcobinamide-phosphate synthase
VIATKSAAVAAGLVADRWLGEPPAPVHPVALFGKTMQAAERRLYADRRSAGVLYALVGTAGAATAGHAAARMTRKISRRSGTGSAAAICTATYVAVASRALIESASRVARALTDEDLRSARQLLPELVGRNPSGLGTQEISRAVVESLAENTVDAVVAPALWAAVGGAPGVLAYRAVNTLDAMVGHRSARYLRFGWAAAKADDVAGWVPARATALLVACVRPTAAAAVLRAVRAQAPAHPSPNAGVAEAAFAAALGRRFGGANVYDSGIEERPPLGEGPPPSVADIKRAGTLSRDVVALLAALLAGPYVIRIGRRHSRTGTQRRRGPR